MLACVALRSAFADASALCASESSRVASTKPCVYVHSFGKKDARNASGDLCRYGGAPLRGDIPARVEQGLWPVVRGVCGHGLHRRCPMHVSIDSARNCERSEQEEKNNPDALASIPGAALVGVDAQRSEIWFYGCFRHSWAQPI